MEIDGLGTELLWQASLRTTKMNDKKHNDVIPKPWVLSKAWRERTGGVGVCGNPNCNSIEVSKSYCHKCGKLIQSRCAKCGKIIEERRCSCS